MKEATEDVASILGGSRLVDDVENILDGVSGINDIRTITGRILQQKCKFNGFPFVESLNKLYIQIPLLICSSTPKSSSTFWAISCTWMRIPPHKC